mmetsp:Transcript_25136/g.82960  ORF Transcript_25136/g.82960 Transcript_25136/m.82960 type:complete len:282 (+) Transcript_25136:1858-2703(+)
MLGDACIAQSSSQRILGLLARHVVALLVLEEVAQAVVDQVDLVRSLLDPHEKVLRLDVPMDDASRMDVAETVKHLMCKHQPRLGRDASLIHELEKILHVRAQQLHHQDVAVLSVQISLSHPVHVGDPWTSLKVDESLCLRPQRAHFLSDVSLRLHRHLLPCLEVRCQVDPPKRPEPHLLYLPHLWSWPRPHRSLLGRGSRRLDSPSSSCSLELRWDDEILLVWFHLAPQPSSWTPETRRRSRRHETQGRVELDKEEKPDIENQGRKTGCLHSVAILHQVSP